MGKAEETKSGACPHTRSASIQRDTRQLYWQSNLGKSYRSDVGHLSSGLGSKVTEKLIIPMPPVRDVS